jgi:hypothetical protein
MKRLVSFLVPMIIVGILVLSGCEPAPGSPAYNKMLRKPPAGQVSGGSTSTQTPGPGFHQAEIIPADKALVYIYRPGGFTGGLALPFGVKVNGKTLITLVQEGYYAYLTEPGQIEFTTFEIGFMAPSSVFSVTVDARAQQAYYLKGAHGKGAGGRASLQLVSPETGANEIANCKLISSP